MNELIESFIWIVLAVGVPSMFVLACINMKPHESHIWEMNRVLEEGIVRNEKGQIIPQPKKPWYSFLVFWK